MMKAIIVFTIFLVHSSWAWKPLGIIDLCPSCGCIEDFKYSLDVTLKRGENICGRKSPIKEGWNIKEDNFQCTERKKVIFGFRKKHLNQNDKTFDKVKDNGKSRIPTTGTYRLCLKVKCIGVEDCTVTLTKNGAVEELLNVESQNGRSKETCVSKELKNTDEVQVNSISTDNSACLDTSDETNNKLTIKLEEKKEGKP